MSKKIVKEIIEKKIKKLKAEVKIPSDVTFNKNPIVLSRTEPTIKEQKLNEITAVLKHRMHPRELSVAVIEIRVILESAGIIWGS